MQENTTAKYCADPCCGKVLVQGGQETKYNWTKRMYCGRSCARQHQVDKGNTTGRKNNRFAYPQAHL